MWEPGTVNFLHPLAVILEFCRGNEGGPERGTVKIESESQSQSHMCMCRDLHLSDMILIHCVTKECMCCKLDCFIGFDSLAHQTVHSSR